MKTKKTFKRLLLAFGLLILLGAGYTGISILTAKECQAQTCRCQICIVPNSLVQALQRVYSSVTVPGVNLATSHLSAYFNMLMNVFDSTVTAKIDTITNNTLNWWDTFWWYNLKPSLQDITDQLATAEAAKTAAIGKFIDAGEINRTRNALRAEELAAHRELRPGENVCVAGAASGGIGRAAALGRAYNAAAGAESLLRSGNDVSTPAAQGRATDQKSRWSEYITRYCDPDFNAGAAGCTAAAPFVGRDLDVTGEIFAKDTIDITNPDTKKAIDTLIANIAEPFVRDPILARELKYSDGQKKLLENETDKTQRQTVYDALYHAVARRAPGSRMGELIGALRVEAGIDLSQISANPSYNEVMEALANERYRTGQYALRQIDEPENNGRELVLQQALQTMQLADQLDLLDRYALIVAARAGNEVKKAKPFSEELANKPQR